jgi:hypothetical protein
MKNKILKPEPFTPEMFKNTANKAYFLEIQKLMFQKDGQGRLVFYVPDIFEAFKNIENTDPSQKKEIKRAIAWGFGIGIQEILAYNLKDLFDEEQHKQASKQVFLGQLIKKNAKVYLDVEGEIYYSSQNFRLTYKHRFCSDDCDSEEVLEKFISKAVKSVKNSIKNKQLNTNLT